jgi:hypothetical protein
MCQSHTELLQAYSKAVAVFSATSEALEAARTSPSMDEYARLAKYADEANMQVTQARDKLEAHTAEHGCVPLVYSAEA